MENQVKIYHPEIESLKKALGAPSIDMLIYALRHPETWPKGFVWDFEYCSSCAMGLAQALWGDGSVSDEDGHDTWVCVTAKQLAIGYSDAVHIFHTTDWTIRPVFFGLFHTTALDFEDITPEMVADELERYMKKLGNQA